MLKHLASHLSHGVNIAMIISFPVVINIIVFTIISTSINFQKC